MRDLTTKPKKFVNNAALTESRKLFTMAFTKEEYEYLIERYKKSYHKNVSSYLKSILFHGTPYDPEIE